MREEQLILSHLIFDESFSRKVLPYIKSEYFSEKSEKLLFQVIEYYTIKYNRLPTKEVLFIDINKIKNLDEDTFNKIKSLISEIQKEENTDHEYLVHKTEEWCKNRAVYNAIMDSISIYDNKHKDKTITAIPGILSDAISINFDQNIGHDYLLDVEERWNYYHEHLDRIPFRIKKLNDITDGGPTRGTLNGFLAGIHVGKSLAMCSLAADYLLDGYNVLYITLELSEKEINRRIDANLLNTNIGEIKNIEKQAFSEKIQKITSKTQGKLITKQFPTATAGAHHFRHLIHELKLKKKFKPDVVMIDYINLCISSRIKASSGANSYTLIKSIAEELRGLMIEENIIGWTATQLNRSGFSNSDVGMEDTAEAFSLPAVLDFFLALTQTDELKELNQYLAKQLKNRHGDISRNTRFILGVDKLKMRIYDVEEVAQNIIQENSTKTTTKKDFSNWS